MDKFTIEEINLMCIYDISNRKTLISEIKESLPHVYEPELIEIMETVINKLEHITNEEFAEIEFEPVFEFIFDEQEE